MSFKIPGIARNFVGTLDEMIRNCLLNQQNPLEFHTGRSYGVKLIVHNDIISKQISQCSFIEKILQYRFNRSVRYQLIYLNQLWYVLP